MDTENRVFTHKIHRIWTAIQYPRYASQFKLSTMSIFLDTANFFSEFTGVGSLSLLQGIFPTQGSNPGLPHFGRILNQLSHKGSPE